MIFENNIPYQTYRIIVSIFCTLGMFAAVTPMKKHHKKNLFLLAGYAVYTIILTFSVIRIFGFLSFLQSAVLTISLPGVIITYMIADTSVPRHIFTCLSQLLLSCYLITSVTLINTMLGGSLLSNAVLLPLAYLLTIFVEFFFLRRRFCRIADTLTKGWTILSLLPSAFFIFSMTVLSYPAHYTQSLSATVLFYAFGAVVLIIYYAIFQYMQTQYEYQMAEQSRKILELQIQNIKKYTADTKRKSEEIRMIWQDTTNMLSSVALLAEQKNGAAIRRFTGEVSALNNLAAPSHYCSDPVLNATLTTYLDRAKSSGITVQLCLTIPETLPVDSAELSICFANALENAIKACKELPKNERKIIVKCICKPKFMFEIANTYNGRIRFGRDGLPQSSDPNHGIGTRSIMAFCEKHGAFFDFTAVGGWFKLMVAL